MLRKKLDFLQKFTMDEYLNPKEPSVNNGIYIRHS